MVRPNNNNANNDLKEFKTVYTKNTSHELFTECNLSFPNLTAIEFKDKPLTCRELEKKTNQIADYLWSESSLYKKVVPASWGRSTELNNTKNSFSKHPTYTTCTSESTEKSKKVQITHCKNFYITYLINKEFNIHDRNKNTYTPKLRAVFYLSLFPSAKLDLANPTSLLAYRRS
jgi:non-ribosomal peptide synthetase component F